MSGAVVLVGGGNGVLAYTVACGVVGTLETQFFDPPETGDILQFATATASATE